MLEEYEQTRVYLRQNQQIMLAHLKSVGTYLAKVANKKM